MYTKSNFERLIDKIAQERISQRSVLSELIQMRKSTTANKMHLESLIKSMQQVKRNLTPTKAELKMENRLKMDRYKAKLKQAVLSKSLTTIEVAKLESAAHRISNRLAVRGLI